MAALTIEVDLLPEWQGNCTECGEEADADAQTIAININGKGVMHFHQVCAWKRMTFIFGELF